MGTKHIYWFIRKYVLVAYYRYLKDDEYTQVSIPGSKLYISLSDPGISRDLLSRGTHEPTASQIYQEELKSE